MRFAALLLLFLCAPRAAGVPVPSWRATAHRLLPALSERGPRPPGPELSARGNLMFWKVHKVGGTTLRHALLRVAARANATVSVLGCTAQREPLQAHLSASHVVCPFATRDYALTALLGRNHSEIVWVRDPSERALSALYYIAMSERRVAAVNALSCGYQVPFMGRRLEHEQPEHRAAFAEHGFAALQACAVAYDGGGAAHVRVFLPQWAYMAASPRAALTWLRSRRQVGRLFVGTTEGFDEALAALARWAGWELAAVSYASRAREYNAKHPTTADWDDGHRAALARAVRASGDATFDDAARAAWRELAAAHGEEALKRDTEVLQQLNARPRSDQERAADRDVRRRRYRPPSPRSGAAPQ